MFDGLPESVRVKAHAQGPEGDQWLDDLPALVEQIEAEWDVDVTSVMHGGSSGLVADVSTHVGTQAVLKIAIPDGLRGNSPFGNELQALLLGRGLGYALVLRHDLRRRAVLLEKLGPPLASLRLAAEVEIAAIAATLGEGWRQVPQPWPLPSGLQKAGWLADDIAQSLTTLPHSCHAQTATTALAFARARAEAFTPSIAVLIHGDAHPYNVLLDPSDPSGSVFKLIDPEGMVSEPAHDLAIPLRQFNADGLSGQPLRDRAIELCTVLSESAQLDPRPIWEWAFVERVTTGLFLARLGNESDAANIFQVANELVGAAP